MSNKLKEIIKKALTKLDIDISLEDIMIETPKDTKNGDYSSNIAMKLAKTLKDSPINIANKIVTLLEDEIIDKVMVANPGFINFYLKKDYLFENINTILIKLQVFRLRAG